MLNIKLATDYKQRGKDTEVSGIPGMSLWGFKWMIQRPINMNRKTHWDEKGSWREVMYWFKTCRISGSGRTRRWKIVDELLENEKFRRGIEQEIEVGTSTQRQ